MIFDGEQGVFDFDEIANHMLEQGVDSSPSAVHGCLCGLLAAGAKNEAEVCLDALSAALDLNVHGELADQVMQLVPHNRSCPAGRRVRFSSAVAR